jgi:SWI/SNF related-matrix-associated actin-dependent regulator of chromatin subfamily C
MASVSFLAACAGPRVAAAAAQAALASLDDEEDAPTAPTTATTDVDGADDGEKKPPAPTDPHSLGPPPPVTEDRCRAAAAAGVAAAAKRAKQLADQEAREIQKLVVVITENQTRKVELKLRFFEDLEAGLNREREQLERLKRHIAGERAASAKLKREREEAEAAAAKTDEPAAA